MADNLLNQNFNPKGSNQIWAGGITYLKTGESWMYLTISMDLYSRRIIGWERNKPMTTDLVERALMRAVRNRKPKRGLIFHSDCGSQYTSHP